jgi:hypothetical protein
LATKRLAIPGDTIMPLAEGRGGCIASDRITVDGCAVGYMYREEPDNDLDSGWRFLAGDESSACMDEATNHAVYDVNTIANMDRDIIAHLDAPAGSAFARMAPGGPIEMLDNDD